MSYSGYRQYSVTRWKEVGSIPSAWEARRLKFAVSLRNEKIDAENAGLEYLGLEHIESWTGKRLEDETASSDGVATRFEKGDVLFGKLRPYLAKVYLADNEGMAATEALVMMADPALAPAFLKYLLLSDKFIDAVSGSTYGAKMPRANWDAIGSLPILLPSHGEQEQIAAFLDWKTAQIDALITKKHELIEKLKEKRLAVITKTVTKGLDPKAPLRDSGISWLGKVPKHWEEIPLGFLITMSGGMTPSMANSEYWEGDIPWVTPKDMKQPRISDSLDHVTQKALAETGLSLVPVGAVLIVVRGMILAHSFPTAVTEAVVTINQDMKALRCGDRLTTEFLFWCLTGFSKVLSNMAQESAHGTRKMETETLKKLHFSVPPIVEQQAITRHLEARLGQLDQLAMATEQTIARLTEYRSALITAATTGKIDLRNWQHAKEAA